MITGNKVILRLFREEAEVCDYITRYNDLNERSELDHSEIYSVHKNMDLFRKNGLWGTTHGTLLITTIDGEMIGSINFVKTTDFELSIGYRIFSTAFRGKGYASEALSLFSTYLFDCKPGITRLAILTAEDNLPSRKLAEKCNYKQEGILRDAYFYRGKMCNWVLYSLLRSEVEKI